MTMTQPMECVRCRRGCGPWVGALAMALAIAAMSDSPALAQNELGNGRRLDNSLQQGTGGYNHPQGLTAQDYRLRNDLVTGNVAGLGYFHGNVGYRAPGEFYGRQSSDALFRFQAQSLSPSPSVTLGQPGTVGSMAYGQPTVGVYRNPTPNYSSDVYTGGRSGMTAAVDSSGLSVQSALPSFSNPTGMALAVPPERTDVARIGGQSPIHAVSSASESSRAGAAPLPSAALPDAAASSGAVTSARIDPKQFRLEGGNAVDPSLKYLHPGLSIALGTQLQTLVKSQRADGLGLTLDQQIEKIHQAMLSPVLGNREVVLGEDVYADILRRMAPPLVPTLASPAPSLPASTPALSPAASTQTPMSAAASPETTRPQPKPAEPAWKQADPYQAQLADPTPEKLEKARQERIAAARRSLGLPVQKMDPAGDSAKEMKEGLTPGESAKDANASDAADVPSVTLTPEERAHRAAKEKLDAIMQSLRYQGPALGTFAGRVDDAVNRSLAAGEQDLQQGRYFDAENRYRLVLQLRPGYPLARMGLVHAQIGSGMLLSAGQNLESLFADHPELIAVRYEPRLLPSVQRLAWVRSEAERMMELSKIRHEPAMLLAYLGYQFNQPSLTRYGLDVLAARRPNDPLLSVLEGLWTAKP